MLTKNACLQVLRHLVAAELADQQGMAFREVERALTSDTRLDGDAIQADSLQILAAATAVNTFFRLHEVGGEDYLLRHLTIDSWADVVLASAKHGLTGITFHSGGTTGAPKAIFQATAHLEAEIRRLADIVGPVRRILCLTPLHHIYGFLWGAVMSVRLSADLIADESAERIVVNGTSPGDLIVAVPDQWRYLASAVRRMPPGTTGVTSTAPADPTVIAVMKERGLGRMLELYGSSETAGIGWRDRPGEPYCLLGQWTRLDARSDHGRLLHESGRQAEAPDRVEWRDDRHFIPVGRRDGAVQVGGINVYPGRVRDRLARHWAVADCAVRPMQTKSGTRLKAFIVLTDVSQSTDDAKNQDAATAIRNWIRAEFETAERPIHLTFGDRLPKSDIGKPADWPVD